MDGFLVGYYLLKFNNDEIKIETDPLTLTRYYK